MSRSNICDLEVGDQIDQTFLVATAELGETKTGKPFVKATVMDRTGELAVMAFDRSEVPEPGVYRIVGKVDEFNGLQLKASEFHPSDEDVDAFVSCSHVPGDELQHVLECYIGEIGQHSKEYAAVLRAIFDTETLEAFLVVPAATKNHHSYRRGLAEHTLSMAKLAESVCNHYDAFYGDAIDRGLVLSGILLHDLGKVVELEPDGFTWTRSVEGELVGHITEIATRIHDACMATAASAETRARLMHVVLAHHGRQEWGSPVEPRMFEAQLVHLIDMIDSRAGMFRSALAGLEVGEMSEWVRPLGGRAVR